MADIPPYVNFSSTLHTTMPRHEIAQLYGALGWEVRKCSWFDYEISSDWAELTIEAESPIFMDGGVADLATHAEELVAPLRQAGI